MVIATVFALVEGGFRIVTRPMERMIARTMRMICVMWTRYFQLSSKERIDDNSCIFCCCVGDCVFLKREVGKAVFLAGLKM